MASKPVTAVIVGAGHRSLTYAGYSRHRPDELQIVGVADPVEYRRRQVAELYGLRSDQLFETAEELAARPRLADAVINGTMDQDHVRTSLPLLRAGYDLLLEKPFAVTEQEMWELLKTARQYDRKVMICHVMRYAPFYLDIRQRVAAGEIGDVISVQTVEHVSYHHMAVEFVRGKWAKKADFHGTMLMAKCCHDLDLIAWMKSGVAPVRVSSFGSNMQFRPEKAPAGAGTRCLVDCPLEADCLYSARKHYIDHPQRWSFYVWAGLEQKANPTIEDKIQSLKTDNPYGRCVWKCDNDVVDHQALIVEFEDGCTASHNMIGGCSKALRSIHLVGTTGEIQGDLEASRYVVRHIDPRPGQEYSEEVVDLNVSGDVHGAFGGHAGGDLRLAADFVRFAQGEQPSVACTTIEDSIRGHLMGFRADRSMDEGRVMEIPQEG